MKRFFANLTILVVQFGVCVAKNDHYLKIMSLGNSYLAHTFVGERVNLASSAYEFVITGDDNITRLSKFKFQDVSTFLTFNIAIDPNSKPASTAPGADKPWQFIVTKSIDFTDSAAPKVICDVSSKTPVYIAELSEPNVNVAFAPIYVGYIERAKIKYTQNYRGPKIFFAITLGLEKTYITDLATIDEMAGVIYLFNTTKLKSIDGREINGKGYYGSTDQKIKFEIQYQGRPPGPAGLLRVRPNLDSPEPKQWSQVFTKKSTEKLDVMNIPYTRIKYE